jgi:hypothetical protein
MHDTAVALRQALTGSGWARTGRLRLLDFDVAVHSDDPDLVALVEELYAPARAPGAAAHVLTVGAASVDGRPGYSVALDGVQVARVTAPRAALEHLLFEANRQSIDTLAEGVVLHAAAAVAGDRAVVLPGAMGAGKSTLVAGLVQAGAGYLTDEAAAIEPGTGRVRPYPKPISLGRPPAALAPVAWGPPPAAAGYLGPDLVVPATAIGPGRLGRAAAAALVVLPTYTPDVGPTCERLAPADALAAVAAHAFHLDRPGMLAALAAWLEPLPCYRLECGDLDAAVRTVLDLAAAAPGSGP